MKTTLTLLIGILASIPAFAGGSSTVGMPNPSAKYCVDIQGATYFDVEASGGELGVCELSDQSMVEAWTLYSASHGLSQALKAFLAANDGTTTPASTPESYCASVGGKYAPLSGSDNAHATYDFCTLADGSMIEARTLFLGPAHFPALAKHLGH